MKRSPNKLQPVAAALGIFVSITTTACAETVAESSPAPESARNDSSIRFDAVVETSGAVRAVALDTGDHERAWLRWSPDDGIARWHVDGVRYTDPAANAVRLPKLTRDSAIEMLASTYEREAVTGDVGYVTCGMYRGCATFDLPDFSMTCSGCTWIASDCSTASSWECMSQ